MLETRFYFISKIGSLNIFKTFKTHHCQQHYLNLTKVVASSKKNEKKSPIATTLINRFERSCGTFGKEKKTRCCQRHWVNLLGKKKY